jgi:hydrogenase/urease accessory protein HupE
MRRRDLRFGLLLVLACAGPAVAHPAPFSYLDLRLNASGGVPEIRGSLTVHVYDAAHELGINPSDRLLAPEIARAQTAALQSLIERRLALTVDGEPASLAWGALEVLAEKQSLRLPFVARVGRPPGSVAVSARLFPYDATHQTFVNVFEASALRFQAVLDGRRTTLEYFSGSTQGRLAVIRRFTAAGIQHILIGPDHLLFLVGLLLLGGSLRRLLLVVTAFTIAHSVTLSLAVLNVFTPSPRLVEPVIALSIVYVGVDNLMIRGGRDVRVWIAFAFGLVHGFGFASVLREMDLPRQALGWSLFSFNAGVEIGQAAVVALVGSVITTVWQRDRALGRRLAFAGSLVIVAAGAYWFVQRVFFGGAL